ncbi:MAG TPA: DUF4837 family protein [bacterium]|nr:DUF4837 family protein [bacterium]
MKMNISKILLLAVLSTIIVIVGCTKPLPIGGDYEIRVLANPEIWEQTEPLIREIFEKIEPTPQPEKLFTIIKQEPKDYQRYKNLLFLSTLDATDELSNAINSNLSEAALDRVKQGDYIFTQQQVWAQDQKIVFLVASDVQTLIDYIHQNRQMLFDQFEDYWREFHRNILFSAKEKIDIEKHLLRTYGWMIRLPMDYSMEKQSAGDRFVMFHRTLPLRWISVFWKNASDPNVITKEWCIAKRDQIGSSQYEGDSVEQKWEEVRTEEVEFCGRHALLLKGLWKNDEKDAGGPFRMYCFFDTDTERIYFIDMHMFAPDLKKSKIHYLRQMDIIARTFKTNLEVKPEDL